MERLTRRARQYVSHLTFRRLVVAGLLYWTPVVILVELLEDFHGSAPSPLDTGILQWIHGQSSPVIDAVMIPVTNLAGVPALVLAGLSVGAWLLWRRRTADFALLCGGLGGAIIINTILKILLHRSRPQLWPQLIHESTYSFPSAHAMMSAALAVTLIIIAWPGRWRWLALIAGVGYSLIIGFSRLYLGVHYPTDVLAGWCMSLVWVLIAAAITNGQWFGLTSRRRR